MFGIGGAISSLPYVAIVAAGMMFANWAIENPLVREAARQGYVTEAEKAALQANLQETQRQRDASIQIAKTWSERIQTLQQTTDQQDAEIEKVTREYEAKLDDSQRACRALTAADLRLLRNQ